jgi:hypothetical protein
LDKKNRLELSFQGLFIRMYLDPYGQRVLPTISVFS